MRTFWLLLRARVGLLPGPLVLRWEELEGKRVRLIVAGEGAVAGKVLRVDTDALVLEARTVPRSLVTGIQVQRKIFFWRMVDVRPR